MDIKNIGAAIKGRRKELKLIQAELAKKTGLSKNYISGLEKGIRNPTVETLSKIAVALDVELKVEVTTESEGVDYNKLKLAVLAGASGIATNKRLQCSTYCSFENGDVSTMQELPYHHAEVILLLLSDCISNDGIDLDTLSNHLQNLDKYELKRN